MEEDTTKLGGGALQGFYLRFQSDNLEDYLKILDPFLFLDIPAITIFNFLGVVRIILFNIG